MKLTKRVTFMRINSVKWVLLISMIALSSTAFAGNKNRDKARHSPHKQYVYGKVTHVSPVYREIRVNNPVKECWSEPVQYRGRKRSGNNALGNTIVGGVIGGIIGHQIGGGRGKDLATAVGTVIGAQAGNNASKGRNDELYYEGQHSRYEEHCETRNRVSYEEVVDGYRVSYRYQGKRYQTTMPYDPGKRIKLKITVEPVI